MSQEEQTKSTYQPERVDTPRPRPKWTIMIYLAGDNNLSANSLSVLQQLESANLIHRGDVRVLACFDANTPRPRGARYLEIKHRRFESPHKPPMSWGLHNDLVPLDTLGQQLEVPPVESPDFCHYPCEPAPTTLNDVKEGLSRFLDFALKFHRADRYMLILYGHGTAVAGNTFLADDNPPSFLRLKDFADVLKRHFDVRDNWEQRPDHGKGDAEGQPAGQDKPDCWYKPALDILACDNCIMNGIEAAYEVKGQVKYVLGSQGLALAVGWPFRKIINAVVRHRRSRTESVAESLLRVCARNLIDFTLMDRSSEQSVCDLTKLQYRPNLVTAVKKLSEAMQAGLQVITEEDKNSDITKDLYEYKDVGDVRYPAIRDAIKLARLEAQSYWGEVFVDLYDFCALLLERCNDNLNQFYGFSIELSDQRHSALGAEALSLNQLRALLDQLSVMKLFQKIARWCRAVIREIQVKKFVLRSYYIGPSLQYSNGVSVYFPWTLPEQPVIFEPADEHGHCASAGRFGISWAGLNKFKKEVPKQYTVKTAFDEYKTYKFARPEGGDWANFLVSFFKATLRNVRRFDYKYVKPDKTDRKDAALLFFAPLPKDERVLVEPDTIDLQKSGSDNDSEEDCTCPDIKNYPRRFYISPADCKRKCTVPHRGTRRDNICPTEDDSKDNGEENKDDKSKMPCVSYLGWNIRGLVAEVIHLREGKQGDADARLLAIADELESGESDLDETDADDLGSDEEDDDETEE